MYDLLNSSSQVEFESIESSVPLFSATLAKQIERLSLEKSDQLANNLIQFFDNLNAEVLSFEEGFKTIPGEFTFLIVESLLNCLTNNLLSPITDSTSNRNESSVLKILSYLFLKFPSVLEVVSFRSEDSRITNQRAFFFQRKDLKAFLVCKSVVFFRVLLEKFNGKEVTLFSLMDLNSVTSSPLNSLLSSYLQIIQEFPKSGEFSALTSKEGFDSFLVELRKACSSYLKSELELINSKGKKFEIESLIYKSLKENDPKLFLSLSPILSKK